MKKEVLYSLRSPYREQLDIIGYKFGSGKKLAAIVGALRGNEIQQMYVCSRMIAELKTLEEKHCITDGIEENMTPGVTIAQFTERMISKNVTYTMIYMFSGVMLSFAAKKYLAESCFADDRTYAYYAFIILTAVLVIFIMSISLRYALVRFTKVSSGDTVRK